MSKTAANVAQSEASHWYFQNGDPCYEVLKADGKGMTPTTLRHARKLNLLPSVTTILSVLDKPALTAWKIEQAVLTVLTSPRQTGEDTDAFVKRVLSTDKEQEAEKDAAAQLGTDIHAAIEAVINGQPIADKFKVYVEPVMEALAKLGKPVWSEKILVGDGYAGRCDLCLEHEADGDAIVDFKSTKRIPKESYDEHKLQLAAYAKSSGRKIRRLVNIYISTTEAGKISVCITDEVDAAYTAFQNILKAWNWLKGYAPVIESK
jgi:hypothetical protein